MPRKRSKDEAWDMSLQDSLPHAQDEGDAEIRMAGALGRAIIESPMRILESPVPASLLREYAEQARNMAAKARAHNGMTSGMIAAIILLHAVLGLESQQQAAEFFGEAMEDSPAGFARECDLIAERLEAAANERDASTRETA